MWRKRRFVHNGAMERTPIIFHFQESDSLGAAEMGSDSRSTPVRAIQNCLVERGYPSKLTTSATWESLEDALGAGDMVAVGYIEDSQEYGHYALVETLTNSEIILADPVRGPHYHIRREEFERFWKDDGSDAYGARMMLVVSRLAGV